MVFGHVDAPRLVHLAEHIDADVEIFHRHYGIFHEVTRHEAFLYVLRHFLARLAGNREPAEHGKVNRALTVHGVGDGLGAAVTAARGGDGRNGRAERLRHVAPRGQRELLLEHGVLAVYHNVDFVFGAEFELIHAAHGHIVERGGILEVGYILRHVAARQQERDKAAERGAAKRFLGHPYI